MSSFRTADLPFEGITNRFIVFYVQYQDVDKAAAIVRIPLSRAKGMLRNPEVKAEIDRRLDMFHVELAKLEAQAMFLNESKLDSSLLDVIDDKQTNPNAKVRAIEVGYKKLGLVKDKVEHSGEGGGPMVFTLRKIEGGDD